MNAQPARPLCLSRHSSCERLPMAARSPSNRIIRPNHSAAEFPRCTIVTRFPLLVTRGVDTVRTTALSCIPFGIILHVSLRALPDSESCPRRQESPPFSNCPSLSRFPSPVVARHFSWSVFSAPVTRLPFSVDVFRSFCVVRLCMYVSGFHIELFKFLSNGRTS